MPLENKGSSFTPRASLINLESFIGNCLDTIDLNVSTLQQTALVVDVNIDDFFDADDSYNQHAIEFYKLFFRLVIIKDYTDFESFEKLQDDTHQCLLKIKDEPNGAWEYLLKRTHGTGCRSIHQLMMLQLIVHGDVINLKLLDAVFTHTVEKDLCKVMYYYKFMLDGTNDPDKYPPTA